MRALSVCVENSNRSQMSQAFAIIQGGEMLKPLVREAGPSGTVNPKAIAAMRELRYDLSRHDGKS